MDDMFRAFFFFCISDFSHLPNAFLTEVNHQQSELEMNQIATEKIPRRERKQGCINGYRSRVRVGRGSDEKANQAFGQQQINKNHPQTPKKQSVTDQLTNRPTDRPINRPIDGHSGFSLIQVMEKGMTKIEDQLKFGKLVVKRKSILKSKLD